MPRWPEKNKEPLQEQTEQPITSTVSLAESAEVVTPPQQAEAYTPPPTDYHEIETDGVTVRRFNPGGEIEAMYKHLANSPKVPFFIPLGWGEKDGAKQWVQANGLAMEIEKGKMVMIPKPTADILMESLKFTAEALNPFVINGDGRIVRAQSGASAKEVIK